MDIVDKLKLLDSGYVDVEIRPLEEREGSGLQIEQFWQCGGAMDMSIFAGDLDEQIDAISQRFRELGGTGYSTMRIPVQCPHQRKIVFDFAAARLVPLDEETEAKLAIAEIERLRARVDALETYVAAVKEVRDNAVIGAEKRAIASEYGRIVGNGPTDEAERKRMLGTLEDRCERLGGHEIIPTEERWACAYCGAALPEDEEPPVPRDDELDDFTRILMGRT